MSQQWLAVGVQPGSRFNPAGSKVVHLFDWSTRTPLYQLDTSRSKMACWIIDCAAAKLNCKFNSSLSYILRQGS